ncbi:MAG: hypothetical protein E6I87_06260 [Chloroflexi bacterium]|nr:MAG: hypothetical protein E6I87_06260 [Chloroflexota bacterium]
MKRFAPIFALLLALSLLASGGVQAASVNTSAKFDWHVSDAFIQTMAGPNQTGAVAKASDSGAFIGHSVRVSGTGTMNTAAMNATGGGTFVHTDATGQVVAFGTWTATSLKSFTFFGCDTGPFPADFCGGVAVMSLHVVATTTNPAMGQVQADGEIWVNCRIHAPAGNTDEEGIKLKVFLNPTTTVDFDRPQPPFENGETLFVSRSQSGASK